MASSLFFMPKDQNSIGNPNEILRNTYLVNGSGEIRTEPPQKSRGRKPGSKTGQQKQKKQTLRGMGVARLEQQRIEEEKKQMVFAEGGGDMSAASPNATRLPVLPDPGVVLQGFPSHGGGPNMSVGGYTRSRFGSGQIMIDPVYSPWGFVETSTHELSSIPNPHMYNASNNRCDTCFKKKRIDVDQNGDGTMAHQNVVRSNGGGFSKYTMVPPPMNGYDHRLPPDQRSQGFFYDHRIARYSAPPSASTNPYFNEATNHTGSMEEFGSGNPRNGTGGVKEYEFFPGKYDNFPGKYGNSVSSVATLVGDCSPNTSTIDLSLKL